MTFNLCKCPFRIMTFCLHDRLPLFCGSHAERKGIDIARKHAILRIVAQTFYLDFQSQKETNNSLKFFHFGGGAGRRS
jgi:hypothetical protein